jgi:lipopolysaccharide transport system ATP-binding protein
MVAVRSLCSRAILLRAGQIMADDAIETVAHVYENTELKESLHRRWEAPHVKDGEKAQDIYLKEAKVVAGGHEHKGIRVDESFELAFCIHSGRRATINLSPHYIGPAGETLFAAPSPARAIEPGDTWFVCCIPANLLNDGLYSVRLLVVEDSRVLQAVDDSLVIEVHDLPREGGWLGKWPGMIRPRFDWRFESESAGN